MITRSNWMNENPLPPMNGNISETDLHKIFGCHPTGNHGDSDIEILIHSDSSHTFRCHSNQLSNIHPHQCISGYPIYRAPFLRSKSSKRLQWYYYKCHVYKGFHRIHWHLNSCVRFCKIFFPIMNPFFSNLIIVT